MCLTNNPMSVKRLLAGKRKTFVIYKVVCKNGTKLRSIHFDKLYKVGVMQSTSKRKKASLIHEKISAGIHAYRTLAEARRHRSSYSPEEQSILRCYGTLADLLGANSTQMVFRQVTVKSLRDCK